MTVKIGYDTNGFSHHRLEDALAILAELGYEMVSITLDHSALNPFDRQVGREAEKIKRLLTKHHLGCVLETSARFLIDPWRKYQPTLVSPRPRERQRRIELLSRAIKLAATLDAEIVSFQSGDATDDAPLVVLQERLVESLQPVLAAAREWNRPLAIEPASQMVVDSLPVAMELLKRLAHPQLFLTVDLAHLWLTGGADWAISLRMAGPKIRNVRIADADANHQDRLPMGQGNLDCAAMVAVLREVGYAGGIYVSLPDTSGDAVLTARTCIGHLRGCLAQGG